MTIITVDDIEHEDHGCVEQPPLLYHKLQRPLPNTGSTPIMGMRHPRPVTSQTTITSTFHMWDSHDHQNGGLPTVGASRNEGQNIGVYFCDMLNCFVQETG